MFIEFQLAMRRIIGSPPYRGESNSMQGAGVKKTSQQRRWDALSQRRSKRKAHPGIRAQNGTRFPSGGPSGKRIPESRLKLGHTFRFTYRLEKPARSPSQNWVEESQNAIAGGQYDCRR